MKKLLLIVLLLSAHSILLTADKESKSDKRINSYNFYVAKSTIEHDLSEQEKKPLLWLIKKYIGNDLEDGWDQDGPVSFTGKRLTKFQKIQKRAVAQAAKDYNDSTKPDESVSQEFREKEQRRKKEILEGVQKPVSSKEDLVNFLRYASVVYRGPVDLRPDVGTRGRWSNAHLLGEPVVKDEEAKKE